jgi:hypothetical protein
LGLAAFLWLDAAGQTTPTTPVNVDLKRRVEKDLHAFAAELKAKGRVIPSEVYALLRAHLGKHPYIYGATLAFKPVETGGKQVKTSPYVYRKEGRLVQKDLIEGYDYTAPACKWYVDAVKRGRPVWSEPYFDAGGGDAWMITYSIPLYTAGKQPDLIGILTSDVELEKAP